MTILVQTAPSVVQKAKASQRLSRHFTVQGKIRKGNKDQVNKESKRTTWTKKEHPLINPGTDSSRKDRTYLQLKKSLHSLSRRLNEWGSWKSSRIDKTTRTLKQHTKRVQRKHWPVRSLFHRPMIKKILLQQRKLQSRYCSHRPLITRHRCKRKRRRHRMWQTSMRSSTLTRMWSTTDSSFAEKF